MVQIWSIANNVYISRFISKHVKIVVLFLYSSVQKCCIYVDVVPNNKHSMLIILKFCEFISTSRLHMCEDSRF